MRQLDINKQTDPNDKYGFKNKLAVQTNFNTGNPLEQVKYGLGETESIKAGQGIIDRFSAGQDKINEDLGLKTDALKDKLENPPESDLGKFGGAGIDALGEVPKLINAFDDKPKSGKEATGQVLQGAASGAKIGANFGPWGMAVGAVAGAGAGIIAGAGWKDALLEEEDKLAQEELDNTKMERARNYYLNSSSEQLQSQLNLHKKINGYNS